MGRQLGRVGASTPNRQGLLAALWAACMSPEPLSSALGGSQTRRSLVGESHNQGSPEESSGTWTRLGTSDPKLQEKVADRQISVLFHLFTLHLQLALREKPCPRGLVNVFALGLGPPVLASSEPPFSCTTERIRRTLPASGVLLGQHRDDRGRAAGNECARTTRNVTYDGCC